MPENKFPMPPSVIPTPEPPQEVEDEDWTRAVTGTPEEPVKNPGSGTWSAGGLVRFTLCVDEDNNPRCYYCNLDMSCSGPPNESMRVSMTECVAYRSR